MRNYVGPLGVPASPKLGKAFAPGVGYTTIRLVADVPGTSDGTSITLANVTGLSFALAINEEYEVEAWTIYTTAAATTGFFLTATGPTSPTAFAGEVNGSSGPTTNQVRMFNAYDGGTPFGNSTSPGNNFLSGKFFLRNGVTPGTFQLRFASEVASSQVIVKAGSFIKYRRLV